MSDSTSSAGLDAVEVVEADDNDRGKIELVAAILLGIAGLLTAYAAYFGGLAGGDAIKGYSEATISRNEANGYYADYSQKLAQDTSIFLQYAIAAQAGNDTSAQFIRDRLFSPELETAYVAWEQLEGENDVPTPLDTPEYVVEDYTNYQTNFDLSQKQFDDAAAKDDRGDFMDLASIFLAVALFFAGIAALFKGRRVSIALLCGSAVVIIPGCWAIAKGKGWIS